MALSVADNVDRCVRKFGTGVAKSAASRAISWKAPYRRETAEEEVAAKDKPVEQVPAKAA